MSESYQYPNLELESVCKKENAWGATTFAQICLHTHVTVYMNVTRHSMGEKN